MSFHFSANYNLTPLSMILKCLPVMLTGLILVHGLKMMRLYLVLLDEKVELLRFILVYLKTTLANLVIPLKLGEIYRVFVLYRLTGDFLTGLFSMIVDRFFDTLALLMILLPFQLFITGKITSAAVFLTVFVTIAIFVYFSFGSIYGYLNRYIIINRTSKRSMSILKALEAANNVYLRIRKLVSGRYALMLLFSFGAWIVEIFILYLTKTFIGIKSSFAGTFSDYISAILSTKRSFLQTFYTVCSIVFIAVALIVMLIVYFAPKNGGEKK